MAEDGKFSVEKFNGQNFPVLEDVDGRLSVLERFVPTIERKKKEADDYDRRRIGDSQ